LKEALAAIPAIREQFWRNVRVLGTNDEFNQALEKANRVADFIDLAELMCLDALERAESCGCHFRDEFQTADGEAQRDDAHFCNVSAWEYSGVQHPPILHTERLEFEYVPLTQRSYK
jgi:succinate dehydrogenase / fumarate reductase flavoprotein subunit